MEWEESFALENISAGLSNLSLCIKAEFGNQQVVWAHGI